MEKHTKVIKSKCRYCGNNPIPHLIFWYNESFNIVLTGLRQQLLYNPFTYSLKMRGFDRKLSGFFLKLGEVTKIITRQNNPAKCKVRRAQVLWEEAEKRGIKMCELLLFGRPFDCYAVEPTGQLIFSGLPRPDGYFNNQLDLMDDKWWFKQKMMESGLPIAKGSSCTTFEEAKKVFEQIKESTTLAPYNPCTLQPSLIVKPRAGSRGRHNITFIYTLEDLKFAFKIAKQLCHWVIVEEQLFGPVYRATVINFELAGVLRGDVPEVEGDGVHTIAGLIEIKNNSSHPGVKNIVIDSLAQVFLSRQGFDLSFVPKPGQKILISEKIGVNYGGSSAEEFEICHPDNKELFIKAAKVLGDPIVGFDFMIPDITKSYKEQKCGFLEANTLPFINLHHDPLHGKPRNVAGKVWDMVIGSKQ